MEKDFDVWNAQKKKLNTDTRKKFCHVREVWWCSFGVNVGFEEDGKGSDFRRPVLVLRGFNEHIFLGVALTSKKKSGKYYFPLGVIGDREACAILSQIKLFDARRLISKIGVLNQGTFIKLKSALWQALFQ